MRPSHEIAFHLPVKKSIKSEVPRKDVFTKGSVEDLDQRASILFSCLIFKFQAILRKKRTWMLFLLVVKANILKNIIDVIFILILILRPKNNYLSSSGRKF